MQRCSISWNTRARDASLEFDPATSTTRTIVRGLCFPNGVALTQDEQHLIVAETGSYRIWKFQRSANGIMRRTGRHRALRGPRRFADAVVLIDNLPGFPDNVTRGDDGTFWTGLTKPRSAAIDGMAERPWLRAMTLRLPKSLWPVPPAYGHVIGFDADGRVVAGPAGSRR